jgi:hypothetical protein
MADKCDNLLTEDEIYVLHMLLVIPCVSLCASSAVHTQHLRCYVSRAIFQNLELHAVCTAIRVPFPLASSFLLQ